MDRFVERLAEVCRAHPTAEKWVVLPSIGIGLTIGERLAREGRPWIKDYKTDVVEGDPAPWVGHYAPQVRLYARHKAAITGQPVLRSGLFFVRSGRTVWLD